MHFVRTVCIDRSARCSDTAIIGVTDHNDTRATCATIGTGTTATAATRTSISNSSSAYGRVSRTTYTPSGYPTGAYTTSTPTPTATTSAIIYLLTRYIRKNSSSTGS